MDKFLKYINMLIFFNRSSRYWLKKKLSFILFFKRVLFSKNNLETDGHSQVIHLNKYKYKFNFILNFVICLSG